jgi:hypothetical protein
VVVSLDGGTSGQSSEGRRPEKSEVCLNEAQSVADELELNSQMPNLHRAQFASVGD